MLNEQAEPTVAELLTEIETVSVAVEPAGIKVAGASVIVMRQADGAEVRVLADWATLAGFVTVMDSVLTAPMVKEPLHTMLLPEPEHEAPLRVAPVTWSGGSTYETLTVV